MKGSILNHQILHFVNMARMCRRDARKFKTQQNASEWRGRSDAYMQSARYLAGRVLSTGELRRLGLWRKAA
jgi:hypothetical protein